MTQADDLIGKQIDQYRVKSHIASGGMADVYLAEDIQLSRPVALKVMLPEMARQPDLVARFQREGKAVARLDHPHIVNIYTIGVAPDAERPYLAMQYVDGGSLLAHLRRLAQRGEQMAPDAVLALLHPIAEALDAAHRAGVVHRDLKPSNILLRRDGTPLLTDLGIAALTTATTRLTQTNMVLGTPHYMSPEQAGGKGKVDGRSDIYSLGVILYEMLAGDVPFDGENSLAILHQHLYEPPPPLAEARPGLSRATCRLVDVCLRKDAAQRFGDARQLAEAIAAALAVERGERPDTPLPQAGTASDEGRRVLLPYAAGGGVLLLLGLLAFLFWPGGGDGGETAVTLPATRAAGVVPGETATPPATASLTPPAENGAPAPVLTSPPSLTATPSPSAPSPPTETATPTATATPTPVPPPPQPPQPADVAPGGTIVFTCYVDGVDDICSAPAGGGAISRLTAAPATDFYPSFSLATGRVYFSSRRDGGFRIYSMNPDGSGVQALNSALGGYYAPAVSPDGGTLAVTVATGAGQDIWVMNLDGSEPRRLTQNSGNNVDPVWSPDGTQLAFSSDRDGEEEGDLSHYVMDADGGDVRRIETGLAEIGGRSDWSPDGQWLAFYAGPSGDRDIFLTAVDGTAVYQLSDGGGNLAPSFSPDGDWIAFTSYRDGDAEIFIMNSDGSNVRQLTFNDRPDWQPRWGR